MEGESPTLTLEANSKAYSGPCQTSKIEVFAKVVNGFSFFDYFWKNLDVWKDPEFASEASNDLWKKLHLRYLTGLWIHLCINYFRKTIAYLFTKFDQHIPPYIKQYGIVHGQIHVTLCSKYLLSNQNFMFPNHVFL